MNRKLPFPKGTWMELNSTVILRELMEKRGFGQARLARYAGCSQSFISQLLNGRKKSCSQELAEEIAEALSTTVSTLFVPSTSTDGRSSRKRNAGRARRKVAA